jgi:protein-S-isoprenylcysteine O-methyltransferase Ste14
MNDLLALITLMFWPVIPLFWIPVHFAIHFFRRRGLAVYLIPAFTWLPLAFLIYKNRAFLMHYKVSLPLLTEVAGWVIFVSGMLLHIWTARLLGPLGIIGVPEVWSKVKKNLVSKGPFSIVRHPTYFAHSIIFSGVFLITGSVPVLILTLFDLTVVNTVIIPLEEKELAERFGDEFISYKKRVRSSFFPWFN